MNYALPPTFEGCCFFVFGVIVVPSGALAPDASPAAELGPPSAAECQIEPRSDAEIASLGGAGGTPMSSGSGVDESEPIALPDGEPVDDATQAAIEQTLREVVACAQAGDLPRLLALYSDAAVERLVLAEEPVPIVPVNRKTGCLMFPRHRSRLRIGRRSLATLDCCRMGALRRW